MEKEKILRYLHERTFAPCGLGQTNAWILEALNNAGIKLKLD